MALTPTATATSREYFEAIYAEARGDASLIPWSTGRPRPALVTWLNVVAPSLTRCGARVAVVGCGLGEDARELIGRGYEVTAFDCSETAVQWARDLDEANAECYHVADLFELPARWRHRHDLVVEVNTLHWLPDDLRAKALRSITELLSPHGHLLVICRASEQPASLPDNPPWALTQAELEEEAAAADLVEADPIAIFADEANPPARQMRALFRRK